MGGAVRDKLLGLVVKEKDWVVVGSTPDEMISKGFKPVGKDFPVYLHPETGDEYALARTERKSGPGHKGFEVSADTNVSLEEDLKRRDLTINAIAEDESGKLIDPYGGQQDIKERRLKHVSKAFSEDPLRVLRVARFASRFDHLGFSIDEKTLTLLASMVKEGFLSELTSERVWRETDKALSQQNPETFFRTLNEIDALKIVFPGVGDIQIELLQRAASSLPLAEERFALMLGTLVPEKVKAICKNLKAPNLYTDMAQLIAVHLEKWKDISSMDATQLVEFVYQLDGFRREERLDRFSHICQSIAEFQRSENVEKNHKTLTSAHQAVLAVNRSSLDKKLQSLEGKSLGEAIKNTQIDKVSSLLKLRKKTTDSKP